MFGANSPSLKFPDWQTPIHVHGLDTDKATTVIAVHGT